MVHTVSLSHHMKSCDLLRFLFWLHKIKFLYWNMQYLILCKRWVQRSECALSIIRNFSHFLTSHSLHQKNFFFGVRYTVCPNKTGKPVLSVGYLHYLIKLYDSLSRAFSLLSFDIKHMMISQCMTEKEQFKLMHVKIDLRRIMVSWYDQVQTS